MHSSPLAAPRNRFRARTLGMVSAAATTGGMLSSTAFAQIVVVTTTVINGQLVDFDSDAVLDLATRKSTGGGGFSHSSLTQTGQIVVDGSNVDRLSAGDLVSADSTWSAIAGTSSNTVSLGSEWWTTANPGDTGYFGFSFVSGSSTYYGWGELSNLTTATSSIIGWAYNSSPGASIRAGQTVASPVPEPGTSALVAGVAILGGAAWLKQRRRRAAITA